MTRWIFALLVVCLVVAQDCSSCQNKPWPGEADSVCDYYAEDPIARCSVSEEAREKCCACNGGTTASCESTCNKHVTVRLCDIDTSDSSMPANVKVCNGVQCTSDFQMTTAGVDSERYVNMNIDIEDIGFQATQVCFEATGNDGLCFDEVKVDYVEKIADDTPRYIDTQCEDTPCQCDRYPQGEVAFKCQFTEGESRLYMQNDVEKNIIVFPANTNDIKVGLSSEVDFDIIMFEENTFNANCGDLDAATCEATAGCIVTTTSASTCHGQVLVGYDGLYEAGTHSIYGMNVYYSGDDRGNEQAGEIVTETLTIDRTDRVVAIFVHSYGDGFGNVTFQWSGAEPCDANFGCLPCSDWQCKPPSQPTCDGANKPICLHPDLVEAEQLSCDLDQREANCGSELCIALDTCTDSPTTMPTPSPTLGSCDSNEGDCEAYNACLEEKIDELETDIAACETKCTGQQSDCEKVETDVGAILNDCCST